MQNLFVYGTLCHLPLLEIVLGRPAPEIETIPATLADHAVFWAQQGPFPVIVPKSGEAASGLLLQNLSEADVARLNFYEGGYDYDLADKVLDNGQQASVYFPRTDAITAAAFWVLSDWVDQWSKLTLIAAREAMQFSESHSVTKIAQMFPMIRARAASRLSAKHSKHGAGTLDGNVDIVSKTRIYTDFFALDHYQIKHEKFNGTSSGILDRAIFVGADAAIVLPYDPVRDRVLLVEQLRVGPIGRGDPHVWQYEPIAGRIDAGEGAEQAAIREAYEEAKIKITNLEPVVEAYPSPGTSTEFYYAFVGLADLPDDVTGVSGLETENEDIRTHILSFDALLEMVENLQAANVPLALLTYWLAHHRDRLRTGA